jgi:hypothetical protein
MTGQLNLNTPSTLPYGAAMQSRGDLPNRANQDIDRLRHEGDALRGPFSRPQLPPTDPAHDDAVELWGRRIGRGLAVIATAGLLVYFFAVHVR